MAREMVPFFTVSKVQAGRNRFIVEGEIYVYRSKRRETWGTLHTGRDAAELMAAKMTAAVFEQAADDNARMDIAAAFIARRRNRAHSPQLQLL